MSRKRARDNDLGETAANDDDPPHNACVECCRDRGSTRNKYHLCRECFRQRKALSAWAKTLEKTIREEVKAKGPLRMEAKNDVSGAMSVRLGQFHGSITVDTKNADDHVMAKCPFCYGDGFRATASVAAGAGVTHSIRHKCDECRGFGVVRVNKDMIAEAVWYKIGNGHGWTLGTTAVEPNGTIGSGEVRGDLRVRRSR